MQERKGTFGDPNLSVSVGVVVIILTLCAKRSGVRPGPCHLTSSWDRGGDMLITVTTSSLQTKEVTLK